MAFKITHFSVGNGNCSMIEADNFLMIIDINKTEDAKSSYELLKPFFRKENGKYIIDVLYITHGDEDHCLGFTKFKEEIDKGNLIIGTIWHQGFDREKNHNPKTDPELSKDYLQLNKEIKRREKIENPTFGELQKPLKAKDSNKEAFEGITPPVDLLVKVVSPLKDDDEDSGYCHNDMSLIINFEIKGKSILYTGDASSKYWQERIIPEVLSDRNYKDWAKAEILEVAHHGSYDFFGVNRDDVREAEEPDNYEALNRIEPSYLIVSAESKFPTNGDSKRDQPPHYGAWKWYHKWFRDNRNVKENDKHPKQFKYTSEGTVRLEYKNSDWSWIDNSDIEKSQAYRFKEKMKAGGISIGTGGLLANRTRFYGDEEV